MDPHSAVGYLGIESGLLEFGTGPSIFLMTAHPIKFRETVEQEIDSTLEIPEIISSVLSAKRQVVSIGNDVSELRDFLIENKET